MLFLDMTLPQVSPREESIAIEAWMLSIAGGCTMQQQMPFEILLVSVSKISSKSSDYALYKHDE